jgi:transposase
MSTKTRRSYTETFMEEAVRLVRESWHPVAQESPSLAVV